MSKKPLKILPQELQIVQQILLDILPENAKIWVFGSRVTLKTKNFSDLDLAIDVGRPITRKEDIALADAFDESSLSYKVDVVDMHNISDTFKKIIQKDMVELDIKN